MSDPKQKQPEPTMEEILASIRRIISDDDQPASTGSGKSTSDSAIGDDPPMAVQPTTTGHRDERGQTDGDRAEPDDGFGDDVGFDESPFELSDDDRFGGDDDPFAEEPFSAPADAESAVSDSSEFDDDDILDLTEPADDSESDLSGQGHAEPDSGTSLESPAPKVEPDSDDDPFSFDDHDPMTREEPMAKRDQFEGDHLDFEKAFDEATGDDDAGFDTPGGFESDAPLGGAGFADDGFGDDDFSDDESGPGDPNDDDPDGEDTLVSGATAAAAAAAFSKLTEQPEPKKMTPPSSQTPIGDGSKTLEQMVREMLKPMLRDWLDQNLQPIVEDAVQREIKRVVGGQKRR